jgi:deoxyribose-phosphate aldolase
VKRLCASSTAQPVHLKVILETGELGTYDNIRRASDLALEAGADVIKTSTGKVGTNATYPTALVMCEAIRDFSRRTGELRGLKVAGGVRTTKQALTYLVIVKETLGDEWLNPDLFRIGASSLLDDLLMQLEKEQTGHYAATDYIPKD